MTNILDTINSKKAEEISQLRQRISLAELEAAALNANAPRGFTTALQTASQTGYGLIAELKKASPSKGLIRADFDPTDLAKQYEMGGASCLSVYCFLILLIKNPLWSSWSISCKIFRHV